MQSWTERWGYFKNLLKPEEIVKFLHNHEDLKEKFVELTGENQKIIFYKDIRSKKEKNFLLCQFRMWYTWTPMTL